MIKVQFLERGDKRIAYMRHAGASPGVIFCGGFRSDMTGSKALALDAWARERGRAFLRFDYRGHGASSGAFEDGTIGQWLEDALDAFDILTEGPQVVVGSSMGGWIALLMARARPERVAGLVGVAPAPDFTEHLLREKMTKAQTRELEKTGRFNAPACNGAPPYVITRELIEEGRKHRLLGAEIPVDCPVHLLHGMKDEDVPWQISLSINEKLRSKDVKTTLVEDGDHRLSEPPQLASLCRIVERMCGKVGS